MPNHRPRFRLALQHRDHTRDGTAQEYADCREEPSVKINSIQSIFTSQRTSHLSAAIRTSSQSSAAHTGELRLVPPCGRLGLPLAAPLE